MSAMRGMMAGLALALASGPAPAGAAAEFTSKPTVVKADGKTTITFAVSAPTDVAVSVEDAQGKIVRHLAAGLLGANPPAPLKAHSLVQSLDWDGRDDDGNVAQGGPFSVRVGLGLTACYAGQPFAAAGQTGPNKIEPVMGLAVGAGGRVYVLAEGRSIYWGSSKMHVFGRDGAYEKTIKPFPSNLPVERAKAAGAFINSFGKFNPFNHRVQGLSFYPAEEVAHQPAVTPDGQVVLATKDTRLAVLDRDGGIPNSTYAGPPLGAGLAFGSYPFLAVASDGTRVYISGLAPKGQPAHAVYAVRLPERGPAAVWFGDPGKPGSDSAHLNNVRGLALDGRGHLLVADFGNDRVLVLNEKDRSMAGSLTVPTPTWVAAGRDGAVYVQSGNAVVKFSGWQNGKEVARLELPAAGRNQSWKLAIDASGPSATLWAALGTRLVRGEERDGKFGDLAPADCYAAEFYWRPTADPYRREVLCKRGGTAGYGAQLDILDESTGKVRTLGGREIAGMEGRNHRLGPDGGLYAQDHAFRSGGVLRMDRDGKPRPYPATLDDPYLKGRLPMGFTGTTMWERDFSVDRRGNVYVKARGPEYHGLMSVHEYDPDGRLKRIALQVVSDGSYGPRVDPQGNLYLMEAIKAPGEKYPPEFNASVSAFPSAGRENDWIYGGIVKFGPEGGAVWFSGRQATPFTYEGWGSDTCIANLRTTGGALTGAIAKPPAKLSFPGVRLDPAKQTRISIRLKNQSDGARATLFYHNLGEGYIEACGPGKSKSIDIKPQSDFTEYAFEMAGEPNWKGPIWNLSLVPTDAAKGAFSIDWVRVEGGERPLAWEFNAEDGPELKLPATLRKEPVGAFNRPGGAVLQGAHWWKAGFSPVADMATVSGYCHCTGSDFDVDDFGRTFAPDTGRFRIGVLDTNGNEVLSIGQYGNQDDMGGAHKPLVGATDVAFAWITGVAVTDRHLYAADAINRRVLRIGLAYAAEATCAVQ